MHSSECMSIRLTWCQNLLVLSTRKDHKRPYLCDTLIASDETFVSILIRIFSEEELAQRGVTIKVVASTFDDPGEDWCRYELYDKDDTLIRSVTQPGY
jgi:hypothetical protein